MHFHSYVFRFTTVVHYREQRDSFGLENILELFYGFIDRMIARFVDYSFN
jgi:hypothetical protein